MKKSKVWSAASAAAPAGALLVGVPTAAEAAPLTCPGTRISTINVTAAAGTLVGKAGGYRQDSKVCAVLIKQGPVYGVVTQTELYLSATWKDIQGYPHSDSDSDAGMFKYQTDAITISVPKGKPFRVTAYVTADPFPPYRA